MADLHPAAAVLLPDEESLQDDEAYFRKLGVKYEADTPLVTSGIVDSAGVVEVVDFLERRFHVRLADSDISLRNCNTLRGLSDLVLMRR